MQVRRPFQRYGAWKAIPEIWSLEGHSRDMELGRPFQRYGAWKAIPARYKNTNSCLYKPRLFHIWICVRSTHCKFVFEMTSLIHGIAKSSLSLVDLRFSRHNFLFRLIKSSLLDKKPSMQNRKTFQTSWNHKLNLMNHQINWIETWIMKSIESKHESLNNNNNHFQKNRNKNNNNGNVNL